MSNDSKQRPRPREGDAVHDGARVLAGEAPPTDYSRDNVLGAISEQMRALAASGGVAGNATLMNWANHIERVSGALREAPPSEPLWEFADLAAETAATLRKHFDRIGGVPSTLRLTPAHWHLIVLALERAAAAASPVSPALSERDKSRGGAFYASEHPLAGEIVRAIRARHLKANISEYEARPEWYTLDWDGAWIDPGGTVFGPGPYVKLPITIHAPQWRDSVVIRVYAPSALRKRLAVKYQKLEAAMTGNVGVSQKENTPVPAPPSESRNT